MLKLTNCLQILNCIKSTDAFSLALYLSVNANISIRRECAEKGRHPCSRSGSCSKNYKIPKVVA